MYLLFQVFSGDGFNSFVFDILSVDEFRVAYDDAAGVEVVIQRLTFTQEFRREQQVEFLALQGWGILERLNIFHI